MSPTFDSNQISCAFRQCLSHACGMERSHRSLEQVWIDLSRGNYILLKPQSIWPKVHHNSNIHDILLMVILVNRILCNSKLFHSVSNFIQVATNNQTRFHCAKFPGEVEVDLLCSVTDIAMGLSFSWTRPQ